MMVKKFLWHLFEGFWSAFKGAGRFVVIGIVAAFFCFMFAGAIGSKNEVLSYVKLALEHLGMGFIVSAIAVFFYEWGSHEKQLLEHSRDLMEVHKDLQDLKRLTAQRCLARSLNEIIGDEKKAKDAIMKIILELSKVKESSPWTPDGLRRSLVNSLERIAENAQTVSALQAENSMEDSRLHYYSPLAGKS